TVSLGVFNALGQKVATLLNGQVMAAGTQTVRFDATGLPSGFYIYALEVDGHTVSRKMVLLK
ncbi:MAG TPA: T9SS type A sorting domain-containing protein, partial [Rhodothermia bacterium]